MKQYLAGWLVLAVGSVFTVTHAWLLPALYYSMGGSIGSARILFFISTVISTAFTMFLSGSVTSSLSVKHPKRDTFLMAFSYLAIQVLIMSFFGKSWTKEKFIGYGFLNLCVPVMGSFFSVHKENTKKIVISFIIYTFFIFSIAGLVTYYYPQKLLCVIKQMYDREKR